MQRQMLDLLEIATGDTVPTPAAIDLPVDKALVAAAADALPTGPVYVGLSPGAGGLPKCWPLEKFILLAKAQELAGRVPVFILGPQEKDWQREIKAAVPAAIFPLQAHNLRGATWISSSLTIALSRRLAVSVCNDSGTGHACALSGSAADFAVWENSAGKVLPLCRHVSPF